MAIPAFRTPHEWGSVYVQGQDLVPSTNYDMQLCFSDGAISAAAVGATGRWGDTVGCFVDRAWGRADGRADMIDITAALDRFRNAPLAPPLAWCDVAPAVPDGVVDITADIVRIVDAFRGFPYPFAVPNACP